VRRCVFTLPRRGGSARKNEAKCVTGWGAHFIAIAEAPLRRPQGWPVEGRCEDGSPRSRPGTAGLTRQVLKVPYDRSAGAGAAFNFNTASDFEPGGLLLSAAPFVISLTVSIRSGG